MELGELANRNETDCRGSHDGKVKRAAAGRAEQPWKNKARRGCPILSPWPSHGFHGLAEKHIDSYIWALVGGALGGLAGALQADKGHVYRIESVLVGVFGAFVGGDFLVAMLFGPAAGMGVGLGMAVLGAVVMLALLSVMRRAVGPLRPAKKRTGTRR